MSIRGHWAETLCYLCESCGTFNEITFCKKKIQGTQRMFLSISVSLESKEFSHLESMDDQQQDRRVINYLRVSDWREEEQERRKVVVVSEQSEMRFCCPSAISSSFFGPSCVGSSSTAPPPPTQLDTFAASSPPFTCQQTKRNSNSWTCIRFARLFYNICNKSPATDLFTALCLCWAFVAWEREIYNNTVQE